jgi:hypothetical protein
LAKDAEGLEGARGTVQTRGPDRQCSNYLLNIVLV